MRNPGVRDGGGSWIPACAGVMETGQDRLSHEHGLTLVEVLVVLAIIGIVSGVTLAAMRGRGGGSAAHEEAERLAARLNLAADDVRLADRPLGLSWGEHGYGFVTQDPRGGWVPDAVEALGAVHVVPAGLTMVVEAGEKPLRILPDGDGQPLTVRVGAGESGWRVTFDGLEAQVAKGAR